MKVKFIFVITLLLVNITFLVSAQTSFSSIKQTAQRVTANAVSKQTDDVTEIRSSSVDVGPTVNQLQKPITSALVSASTNYSLPRSANVNAHANMIKTDTLINGLDTVYHFNTSTVAPQDFVAYALTLKGTPYLYGSVDPTLGLDCSGLVTHVFNHFNITVPRRTVDFKNAEKKIPAEEARPGDIVLFTGSDLALRKPGHMGIITAVGKDIEFVHASSGQTCAVTTGKLSYSYFKSRLLDIVRVF